MRKEFMMKKIDGKQIAMEVKEGIKEKIATLGAETKRPSLTVILVGEDPASQVYVRNKEKACEMVGIISQTIRLKAETTEAELIEIVERCNEDSDINGILVQMPVPKHINPSTIINTISPKKDVDGFHPMNVGLSHIGEEAFVSCTPAGVIHLIESTGTTIEGKDCVVVGRSNIVGKPMAMLLTERNGTVTLCHSRTKNLAEVCKRADILVCATGIRNTITQGMVKEGAVVIDVGMNRDEEGKLCGDVDFEGVKEIAGAITPVPGGVGPMTIAMLLQNCLQAYEMQN